MVVVGKGPKKAGPTFPVGRLSRFLNSKKKKPVKVRVQRKKKPFEGEIPPCIQAIFDIRALMLLEYAKDQAMYNRNAHGEATKSPMKA